ncbi:Retrovirus-related Pol polyprotein from type-1 retrotransposable element R2 (Fragment) [Anthophora retusa]
MKRFPGSKKLFEEFKELTSINEDCSDTNSSNNNLNISCVENKTDFLDSEEDEDEIEVRDIEQSDEYEYKSENSGSEYEISQKSHKRRKRLRICSDTESDRVWKFGGEVVRERLWEVCSRVWRGEGWPEEWSEGVVVPIVKKGEGKKVEEYRGVTLTQTAYRIYAAVLAGRLMKEIEEKEMIPPNQTGFRKGVGTIDNIYVLNYLINRQIAKKRGKMLVLFVDLKAAFDSVDREILIGSMRRVGVREGLVRRCMEILRETRGKVRVGKKEGSSFWTVKGVRQGCPLSPILFTLLLADMEEELKKGGWGGVKVGGEKVYTLAYADDIAVLAKDEEGMKGIVGRLERYLDEKKLEVNVGETKMMRCKKGGGRKGSVRWRWKGKEIEEVRKYKYLGYVMTANGKQEEHISERVRKGVVAMRQVWGIGKRKFTKDWGRRLWLFDRLVWAVMSYGVEIWGWKEREKIEKVQERYLRWVLGVDRTVPGYMIREELQREELGGRAGMRAWGYERKLSEGKGGYIARKCWREVRERAKKNRAIGNWEEVRREFYEKKGWTLEEVEELREEGGLRGEELVRRERSRQREERWRRIRESRYNKWYKMVKGDGVPGYLKKGWEEKRWQMVAGYRLGSKLRGGRYWEEEDRRSCRICGRGEESWEHIWEECTEWGRDKGWQDVMAEVLGEEGEGEEWMKRVEEKREKANSGNGGLEKRMCEGVNGSKDGGPKYSPRP